VQDKFEDEDEEPPPIRLVVAEGGEDVTIKVWGLGFGGFRFQGLEGGEGREDVTITVGDDGVGGDEGF
jgi:hypothetical protein